MLVLNLDMLVVPVESEGLRSSQTRFYCTFGRKARLIIPMAYGHDYYLLLVPLLLLLLCLLLYFDILSRLKAKWARFFQTPQLAVFRFGVKAIPWHEDRGRELLERLKELQEAWAQAAILRAWQRRVARQLPEGTATSHGGSVRKLSLPRQASAESLPGTNGHHSRSRRHSIEARLPSRPTTPRPHDAEAAATPSTGGGTELL